MPTSIGTINSPSRGRSAGAFNSKPTIPHMSKSPETMVPGQLEKLACGRFSDISSVAADKRRDFCQLRRATSIQCKSDTPLKHL
jgi:hypothetical protein